MEQKQITQGNRELTDTEKKILDYISTSSISSAIEIAIDLNLSEAEVIAILNDDYFYSLICANSLSSMRLAYHSKAIPKLLERLDQENTFIESYDRLTKAIGAVKEKDNESMKVSLEVLLKEKKTEKNITPHRKGNVESNAKQENRVSGNIFEAEAKEDKPISTHKEIVFEFEEDE